MTFRLSIWVVVLTLLGIYYVGTVVAFFVAFRTFLTIRRKFLKDFTNEERLRFRAFERCDFGMSKFTMCKLVCGGLTLFPIRFLLLSVCLVSNLLFIQAFSASCTLDLTLKNFDEVSGKRWTLSKRAERDQATQQRCLAWLRFFVRWHCRIGLWIAGVQTIQNHKVLTCDFDFPQEEAKERIITEEIPSHPSDEPRSVVSNHTSAVDILYFLLSLFPSFISKASTFNHPFIGPCARALNCVFLNRVNQEEREKTIRIIGERQHEIWKLSVADYIRPRPRNEVVLRNGAVISQELRWFVNFDKTEVGSPALAPNPLFAKNVPPLVIFPEGTTSSGRHIMALKRGAFLGLRPVTPVVLVYRCPEFNVSYDLMPFAWTAPLVFSNITPVKLDVYWLRDVMPPSPVTFGWDRIARVDAFTKEVRKQMSRVLLAKSGYDMPPNEHWPEDWQGSMAIKEACLRRLFGKSTIDDSKTSL